MTTCVTLCKQLTRLCVIPCVGLCCYSAFQKPSTSDPYILASGHSHLCSRKRRLLCGSWLCSGSWVRRCCSGEFHGQNALTHDQNTLVYSNILALCTRKPYHAVETMYFSG